VYVLIHILGNVVTPLHERKKGKSVSMFNYHAIKTYGGGVVYLHTFLNLTTDRFIHSSMVYLKMNAAVEWGMLWKEAITTFFKIITLQVPGGTEEC
jgi:hypothetical protein